jgi:hypothetical protein
MLFAGLTDNEIVKHPASFIHFAGGALERMRDDRYCIGSHSGAR